MTDQPLARRARRRAACRLRIARQLPSIALAAGVAALALIATAPVSAKQTCNAAAGSQGYWSWRMIDGRKCWYEGKPMLSKSLLEWPAERPVQPAASAVSASASPEQHGDPMDAQAEMPAQSPTFEALWRSRIEHH